jgi:hypothetical protein
VIITCLNVVEIKNQKSNENFQSIAKQSIKVLNKIFLAEQTCRENNLNKKLLTLNLNFK